MEWIVGSLIAAGGLGLAGWGFFRERAKDELIEWVVSGAPSHNAFAVTIKPIGGEVIDVRIAVDMIGGRLEHPPLAKAEWPVDTPSMELELAGPGYDQTGPLLYVRIIWRSKSRPRTRFEEWFAVTVDGRAAQIRHEQTLRSPLRTWLLRVLGAPVLPSRKGIVRRRVTRGDVRRELRKEKRRHVVPVSGRAPDSPFP